METVIFVIPVIMEIICSPVARHVADVSLRIRPPTSNRAESCKPTFSTKFSEGKQTVTGDDVAEDNVP